MRTMRTMKTMGRMGRMGRESMMNDDGQESESTTTRVGYSSQKVVHSNRQQAKNRKTMLS